MRRAIVAAVGLLCVGLSAAARAEDWADKMFSSLRHDFGSVARSAKAEHRFVITNLYKEDVRVAGVRSSCGCTTPTVSKSVLKTYEKGEIVAVFNTDRFLGQKNATITVTFDQPFYAEVQLQISGDIRSDLVLEPGGIEFGNVEFGAGASRTIDVHHLRRKDWRIVDVRSSNPSLTASLAPSRKTGGFLLQVGLKPDAPVGMVQDQIIVVTNDPAAPEFAVTIEGRVLPEITVSPASLFLGVLEPGQKVTKQVVLKGKRPFKIVDVKCNSTAFEFAPNEDPKAVHLVPVTFVADKEGRIAQKIHIETDLGQQAAADLVAYAQVNAKNTRAETTPTPAANRASR